MTDHRCRTCIYHHCGWYGTTATHILRQYATDMNPQMHTPYLVTLLQKRKVLEKAVKVLDFLQNSLPSKRKCSIHQICNNLLVAASFVELNMEHSVVSLKGYWILSWCQPRLWGRLSVPRALLSWRFLGVGTWTPSFNRVFGEIP